MVLEKAHEVFPARFAQYAGSHLLHHHGRMGEQAQMKNQAPIKMQLIFFWDKEHDTQLMVEISCANCAEKLWETPAGGLGAAIERGGFGMHVCRKLATVTSIELPDAMIGHL